MNEIVASNKDKTKLFNNIQERNWKRIARSEMLDSTIQEKYFANPNRNHSQVVTRVHRKQFM